MISFRGVFPILPTPFLPEGLVDILSILKLVRAMVDLGVDGVTVLGVLGEANRLTDRERQTVILAAVDAARGRIPVVVGVSHAGTHAAGHLAQAAAEAGASAVMVTPHADAARSEESIFEHISGLADYTLLPLVLQDHPGSTGVHMSADLVRHMVNELVTIACIKQEALPSPARVAALRQGAGRKVPILTGLGGLYGAFELAAGADGFMTGFAFPEVLKAMVAADADTAFAIYRNYLPLIVFENQPGVAVRKEIYRRRGFITHATVRAPGAGLTPAAAKQLDDVLRRVLGGVDLSAPLEVALA